MSWIIKLKIWWTLRLLERQFNKEVDSSINLWFNNTSVHYFHDDTQQKYFQGLLNLKKEVKKRARDGSLEAALKNAGDKLLDLAVVETEEQKKLRQLKEALLVRKGQDIKSEHDKEAMINERIKHYTVLQKQKQIRELNQAVRKAYRAGDVKKYEQLKKELENMYGKL